MGVSATALAATCAMESNCQNVGAASGSSAAGAFQMINSTYTADISGAVAYDPGIAGSIVSGLAGQMDPARKRMPHRMNCEATRSSCSPRTSRILRYWMCARCISSARVRARRLRPLTTPQYRRAHWAERGLTRRKWSHQLKHGRGLARHRRRKTRLGDSKSKRVGSITWGVS